MKFKLFTALMGGFLLLAVESFAGQTLQLEVCYATRGNQTYVDSAGNTCKPGTYTCTENSCKKEDGKLEDFKESDCP